MTVAPAAAPAFAPAVLSSKTTVRAGAGEAQLLRRREVVGDHEQALRSLGNLVGAVVAMAN